VENAPTMPAGRERERSGTGELFVEFYDNKSPHGHLVGCMDMAVIPQIGSTISFTMEDEAWGRFRVSDVQYDIKLLSMKCNSYFRTDCIGANCFVDALETQD
jgi:hypothetical protein